MARLYLWRDFPWRLSFPCQCYCCCRGRRRTSRLTRCAADTPPTPGEISTSSTAFTTTSTDWWVRVSLFVPVPSLLPPGRPFPFSFSRSCPCVQSCPCPDHEPCLCPLPWLLRMTREGVSDLGCDPSAITTVPILVLNLFFVSVLNSDH